MITHLYEELLDFIYPQYCKFCEKKLSSGEIRYCRSCFEQLVPTKIGNWIKEVTTGEHLDFAYSAYWFNEVLQDCIHNSKYNGYKRLLRKVSELALSELEDAPEIMQIDVIIPVPLHKVRYRERGFNQADIIARTIGKRFHLPVKAHLLQRVVWTDSQTKLDIEGRRRNTERAFRVKGSCDGMNILLIDDVLTSGATSNSCAKELKDQGAERVGIFTIATPDFRLRRDRSL
ncbi:MAG: ComF family protein [FCB group bacterium]|nr:ComF family protein [FCB group bacterium]